MSEEDKKISKSDLPGNEAASTVKNEDGETSERAMMDTTEETEEHAKNIDISKTELSDPISEAVAGTSQEGQPEKDNQQRAKIKKKITRMDTACSDSLDDSIRKDLEDLEDESDSQSSSQTPKALQEMPFEMIRAFGFKRREISDFFLSDSSLDQTSSSSDPKSSSSSDDQRRKTKRGIARMDTASSDSLDDSIRKDVHSLDVESDSQLSMQDSNLEPMIENLEASCSSSNEQSVAVVQSPLKHPHDQDSLKLQNINNEPQEMSVPNLETETSKESGSAGPIVEPKDERLQKDDHSLLKKSNLKPESSESPRTRNLALDFDSQISVQICEPSDKLKPEEVEDNERNPGIIDQTMSVTYPSDTADKGKQSEEVDSKVIESKITLFGKEEKDEENSEEESSQERTRKRKTEGLSGFSPLKKMPAKREKSMLDTESHESISEHDYSEKVKETHYRKRKQEPQVSPSISRPKSIKVESIVSEIQMSEELKITESTASSFVPASEVGSSSTSDATEVFKESVQSMETVTIGKRKKLSSSDESESMDESAPFVEPEEIIPLDKSKNQPPGVRKERLI